MRQRIRSHLTYANVMASIAVFLVLTGGTALALNGSNTVFSDDIVNREVKTADLGFKSVTANRLAPISVRSGRVVDDSLTGADVSNLTGADIANDSLTGLDVAESSLGQVPFASSADSLNGKTATELEGARASAIVAGGNCDVNSGFCPVVRGKRVAYAFHVAPGKYCVGVDGIPATDPHSIALVSPTFPSPNQWGYWRWAVYGNNEACVGGEYEIYMIYQPDGFSDMRFTIVIP
jgi:hypothetical protein